VRFADADLVGVPLRVTIGKKLAEGVLEIVRRASGEREDVPIGDAADRLAALREEAIVR
jgi:prolyl-tRNA synthetase